MSAMARLSQQAREAFRRARKHYAPPRRMTVLHWAQEHRVMHSGPMAGNRFDPDYSPALRGILEAYNAPEVREIWCCKSAQIGWTQGVVLNVLGYHIHIDPCAILVLFAKDGTGKRFNREKLEPAIAATPVLRDRIRLGTRRPDNAQDYKGFFGGFIQLVGTNSPGNVKSTDARVVIVEEPDDTSKDVKGQGDAITMARERIKASSNGKMVVGGTPTIKKLSKVEDGMLKSDQRRLFVRCPHCQHEQTLRWDQVRWDRLALQHHPVYGDHQPETARYACEACGIEGQREGFWTDAQRNRAVLEASLRPDRGWRAMAPFTGVAGFYLNELYSPFSESRLEVLVRKFLEADHALKNGDDSQMRSFVNNQLGEPWELKSDAPEVEELLARGEDYALWTCPSDCLVATCFVDVQRGGERSGEPRLEYLVVGWGRAEESWRIANGVVIGNPLDPATWDALDRDLSTPIRNAGGGQIHIARTGVDSGDGMTQEAVYRYVRPRQASGFYAAKGSSQRHRPIYMPPKPQDHLNDKAAKFGLKLYLIGTDTAKDTIAGRLKLCETAEKTGRGECRMHWPAAIGKNYLEQITSEIKMPGRGGREEWQTRADRRNEMLDCEVGNLHAARLLRLHNFHESDWLALEEAIRQPSLLAPSARGTPLSAAPNVPRVTNTAAATAPAARARDDWGSRL